MNFSISIFQLVRLLMFLVFLLGAFSSCFYFMRTVGKKEANWLLSFFLGALSLSLLYNLLVKISLFNDNPTFYFIPIWYTLSFGPLLFFFVKSRLFRPFYLQKKDFKHFIIPLLQCTFYFSAGFRPISIKEELWHSHYLPLYKPIEGFLYVIGFSFYLYSSFRFIHYKQALLKRKGGYFWEEDKVNRLMRMLKGLILLFIISAAYIISDFCTYHFLGLNLYNIKGFTYIGDLSFAGIVLWVSYYAIRNGFFPSRKRSNAGKNKLTLLDKIDDLFKQDKIFLDDELDNRKLSFYLKIKTSYLNKILNSKLSKIITDYRIEEVKNKLKDDRYKNYTPEIIGLEAGFSTKAAFNKVIKESENSI